MTEKRIPARFYQNENGNEPVRNWLKDLEKEERRLIGIDMHLNCTILEAKTLI